MEPISLISILFNLASFNVADHEIRSNSNLQFESIYEAKQYIFNDNSIQNNNINSDLVESYRLAMMVN